ncbi:MAG: PepSY domain-containing protein [Actinobacteria bacterium]|nr:PepSY domain-containing protein [Actinomycetota bacterium]
MKRKYAIVAGAVLVLVAGGAGIAQAVGGDGPEKSVTGPQAERAIAAALAVTGGGKANSVERDSEDGATWEVEVTKPDGLTVDVRLDASYELVTVESDSEQEDGPESEQEGPDGE